MDGIQELDRKEESEVLSHEERLRRDELKLELENFAHLEEVIGVKNQYEVFS